MVLKCAFRNITRNTRRSLITASTVAVGAAALFSFTGFNAGVMNQYRDNTVHARYGFGQVNTQGYRDQVFEKPWEHWIANSETVLETLARMEHVTEVFPRIEFSALLTNGQINVSGRGVGIVGEKEASFFNTINIVEGAPLGSTRDGIVLGKGLANSLGVKPGDTVTVLANTVHGSLNGVDLFVTGIFHAGTRDMDDVYFQIQLPQTQQLLDTNHIETIALGLDGYESWEPVARQIQTQLPELEATPFAVLDKIYYQQAVDWLKSQFGIIRLIILSVVLLGIFNTASTSIFERTREIGTLRANGESKKDVLTLLGLEGLVLAGLGTVIGIGTVLILNATVLAEGILMPPGPGITRQFTVFMEFDLPMAVSALILVIFSAVVATLLAGIRIIRMPIGQALRAI